MKKYKNPGDMFNAFKAGTLKVGQTPKKTSSLSTSKVSKPFVPYYGGVGGKMSNGAGWGGEKPTSIKKKKGKKKAEFSPVHPPKKSGISFKKMKKDTKKETKEEVKEGKKEIKGIKKLGKKNSK